MGHKSGERGLSISSSLTNSGSRPSSQEDPKQTLYFAHLFFADHVLSTAWTVFFAVVWWVYTPHDGRRTANSAAQKEMAKGGNGGSHNMTEAERIEAAHMIWNHEKGTAAGIIILSWLVKVCTSPALEEGQLILNANNGRYTLHC
jgi:inositol phosphorylceramide synthase regulatory subunit